MVTLGTKIKALRKQKQITQYELAKALSVSSQSVSKWENHISVPDISVLPEIAHYFGITMDELFDFQQREYQYKERFIRFIYDNGLLRFGCFELKSGRYSPYLIHSGYYHTCSRIAKLGEFYAACIREHALENSCFVSVTCQETALVIAICMSLYNRYGVDAMYVNDCSFVKENEITRNMTLVTDTFTTGETLQNKLESFRRETGRVPSDIIVCVDRMERSTHETFSAKQEIELCYGVKVHSIVDADDIIRAVEKRVIPATEYLQALKDYTKQFKGIL